MCYIVTALPPSTECGFGKTCSRLTPAHTDTHGVRMFCVGCGCAADVALTTVSLFSKRKAADVSRGSDRGEWNVGAIFELNTQTKKHTHTPNPLIAVSAAAVYPFLHLLHDPYCGTLWKTLNPCRRVLQEPNTLPSSTPLSVALM